MKKRWSFPIYEQRLPEMRGRGYGAQALSFSASAKRRSFSKSTRRMTTYPSAARLFMSVPGTRANPFEHIHPPYHSEYKGHRLVVMICPTAISENEYKNFNSYLENVVMKK